MNYYSASFARTKPIDPSSSKSFRKRRKKEEIIIARIIDRKLVLQRNKKKRGRVIETLNECIPSSSSCLSNTSSSWSSKVCPRVLRIVLTFSFSIRPDLVESNMEKALLSTVKNNRILSSCLDDIYILFINKRILFRRSAFSCERFREENLLLAVLLLEAINRFRDRHLASRIDRSSLKLNVYAFRVNKMRGGQLFSKKIKHSRPSIRGYGKWKLYTCWRARARACVWRGSSCGRRRAYLFMRRIPFLASFPSGDQSADPDFYLLFTCSLSSWNRTIVIEWLRFSFTLPIPPRFFFSQRRSSLEIRILSLQTKRHGFDRDSILSPPFVNRCIEGGRIDR